MSALELNDSRRAVGMAARLINSKDEPAAEYVLGRALYRERMCSAADDALLKAERMSPPSAYRCWTALQIGLILGDRETICRECQHLANNPEYAERRKEHLDEVESADDLPAQPPETSRRRGSLFVDAEPSPAVAARVHHRFSRPSFSSRIRVPPNACYRPPAHPLNRLSGVPEARPHRTRSARSSRALPGRPSDSRLRLWP